VLDQAWFDQPVWDQIRSSNQPAIRDSRIRNTGQNNRAPKIQFDKMSHDFGRIRPGSKNNVCEFVFTNVGNANLNILGLKSSCDCARVLLENDKRQYAPGETGKIIAQYEETEVGQAIKHIYLGSNDPVNPKAELAIKAELVAPIHYEPKKIDLTKIDENGNCPEIIVRSLDNKPFAITGFVSKGNCITAQYNPNQKATEFVLKPKVDMNKLSANPEGAYRIALSHPECKVVSGTFYRPPRFTISPRRIVVKNANPSRTVVKKIKIISNYGEEFDVKPLLSRRGVVNVSSTQRISNGYQVTVEINPPIARNNAKKFSEQINLSLPGIDNIVVQCDGYYPGVRVPISKDDEECKTCGPVRVDKPGMSRHPR
jgi:hypothetical protein